MAVSGFHRKHVGFPQKQILHTVLNLQMVSFTYNLANFTLLIVLVFPKPDLPRGEIWQDVAFCKGFFHKLMEQG